MRTHRRRPTFQLLHLSRSLLVIWAASLCTCPHIVRSSSQRSEGNTRSKANRYTVLPQDIHPLSHPDEQFQGQKCPTYYILGEMKCGTTTLWKHAKAGLAFPQKKYMPKSIHVMDDHDALLKLKFKHVAIPTLEATPSYARGLDPALRIKNYCNFTQERPKFVVTLCDPAARTWSHFKHQEFSDQDHATARFNMLREKLTNKTLPGAYRTCIDMTLPIVEQCLSKFTYEQCWRLLYLNSAPGSHDNLDAWGVGRPCHGVIFSSLYTEQLDYWTGIFPREDFLVVYRDDWVDDPTAVVKAMSKHFGVPRSSTTVDIRLTANYHAMFEEVVPPEDVQARLSKFFARRAGWKRYVTHPIYNATSEDRSSESRSQWHAQGLHAGPGHSPADVYSRPAHTRNIIRPIKIVRVLG